MRFRNCIINANVAHAIVQVEKLLSEDSQMIKELSQKNDFKFESGSGESVVKKLLAQREPINVYSYRPWNPLTRAIGYYDGKYIHLNIKAIENFDFNDLCGLLLHEYSHYAGFKHGNNFKTEEKCLKSVPYFLSDNVSRWV